MAGWIFGWLYPDDCRVCERPLSGISRIPVCPDCLSSVEPMSAGYCCAACHAPFASPHTLDERGLCALCRQGHVSFDAAYAYGYYEGTLRRLIHLFKFDRIAPLAGPLGRLMARALPHDCVFDVVVPMPLHWRRRWSRGFNQAELLAAEVARRAGMPVTRAASRRRNTGAQAGLTAAARRRNVGAAFQVTDPGAVKGRRVLLVDDVLTTGATAAACARALKRAGADRVTVLTLARADRRQWLAGLRSLDTETAQAHGASQ